MSALNRLYAPALGLALLSGAASATTLVPLTLEQQVKKADVVVYARVLSVAQESRNVGGSPLPWQVYTLEVLETLVGDAASLPQSGGKPSFAILGGPDVTLEGAPTLRGGRDKEPGGEYILMLYKTPFDSPIVGFNQGIYSVQGGKVANFAGNRTPLGDGDLAAFKNQVIALRGTK